MGKSLSFAIVAGMLGATAALAATPGVNLSWANCATTPVSASRAYACDGALGYVLAIQGSFRASHSIPDFVGCSSVLDIGFSSATPDYWKTNAGECNAGALTISNPTSSSPCAPTSPFDPSYSGGGFAVTYPQPNHVRIRIDWATGAPVAPSLSAGQLYPAFKLTLDPDAGVNARCGDCGAAGCLVLVSVEAFGFADGEDERIAAADVRSYVTWRTDAITATGSGCAASSTSQNRTWGALKSLYR